jgi:hypothetical protein
VIVAPLLAAVLALKTRVDSVRWRYTGREETVSKAMCWRGLIFEASCAYSNISPLGRGGLIFERIEYNFMCRLCPRS